MTIEEREDAINFFKEVEKREVGNYCKLAIEALEQKDIIYKITKEISQELVGYPPSADQYKAILKCLQIIKKYEGQ